MFSSSVGRAPELSGDQPLLTLGLPYIHVRGVGFKTSGHYLLRLLGLQKPGIKSSGHWHSSLLALSASDLTRGPSSRKVAAIMSNRPSR
jgi:hypothetical protein